MKKQFLIIGITLLLIVVGLSGCLGPEVTEYFNEEYAANTNTVLKVTNINGQIEIYAQDGDTVTVDAIKRTRQGRDELEKIEINVTESDNEINVEAKYLGVGSVRVSTDMNIKAPSYVTVDTVTTSNGAVQISGVKGNISAHSSNGAIVIEDIDGYVKASTSNGNIDIEDTTGIGDLETSNGRINTEIYDFKENITISSSNGKITVYINSDLNADIEMITSNGEISISGISLELTKSEEKHIEGKLGDGGNKILIQTSNGDIVLNKLST
jgi:hypothetical protein